MLTAVKRFLRFSLYFCCASVLAACPLFLTHALAELRTWTSSGGGHTMNAEFVSADQREVTIRDEAGKVYVLELDKLSGADRAYVNERLKPVAPTAPTAPAASNSAAGLTDAVKKIDRMEPVPISKIVMNPKIEFPVADFTGTITQLIHGDGDTRVGGIAPVSGFGFGIVGVRLKPKSLPAKTDVCGFFLESPQGSRYPVHLLVVESADQPGEKRTLRGVRSMEFSAAKSGEVIENTYVFMIPELSGEEFKSFRLGFAEAEGRASDR